MAWTLLAVAWQRFSSRLVAAPLAAVLSAALWVVLMRSAHFSGEWVVGGVEAKCFAYVFVVFALAELVCEHWNRLWMLLGLASAFHPVVGGWSTLICAGIWLVDGRKGQPLGGMLSGQEVPSHRFNAGEKVVFWAGVLGLGAIVVVSGLVLDKLIPGLIYERGTMQIAHMVHAVATVVMMMMFLGHIYMGTIGMQGAYKAMKTGYVDETWAKEHHELWYEEVKQKGGSK